MHAVCRPYFRWNPAASVDIIYIAVHRMFPVEKLYTFVVKEDVLGELKNLTKAYLDEYLGKRFKSLEILETIVR